MLRRFCIAVTAALALLSSPCASAAIIFVPMFLPQTPNMATQTGDYSKIRTVAVVSGIGAKIDLTNFHFIGTKSKALDISDWRIDDDAEDVLKKYLGGRFDFKNIAYDRAALAAIPNGMWNNNGAFHKYISTLPADGVDAFIVLRPDQEYEAPGTPGLSLSHGNGMSDTYPVLWANYEIDVIDAKNGNLIGKAYSRIALRKDERPSFAGLVVSEILKTADDLTLTDLQTKILRAITLRLVQLLGSKPLGLWNSA